MAEQRRTSRTPKGKAPQPVTDYGRIQPQAPELEEAVLGALMIEKDAYSLVSEILRPESFYEHRHQLIYSAITDLAVNQKPVDILTVKEQLSKRGELEEVGGPFYITQLSSKVASSAHIEYHARIIAQKAVAVEDDDTPEILQRRVMEQAEWLLLPQAVDDIANGRICVVDGKVKHNK